MKHIILLTLTIPFMALAAGESPVEKPNTMFNTERILICNQSHKIVNSVTVDFNERPIWVGKGEGRTDGATVVLAVNKKTQTWTIVETTGEISCILGTGEIFQQSDNAPTKR